MAEFSSNDPLLVASIELRVKEATLKRDLVKAKQQVQKTTDAMTRISIAGMKNRTKANLREAKMEEQATVRGIKAKIDANKQLIQNNRSMQADKKKEAVANQKMARAIATQSKMARDRIGRMSSAFRMLGVQVTILGAIISVTFKKMLDEFSQFDRSMRKATAVTTFNLSQYTQMSKMAENASIKLNVAATNTADAFYFLGSAGLSAEDQMKAFIPVVTLAKAAVIDAGQAAEIMVDTMKGFKIPFTETAHVAAVLAKSVISSNMNFLQLGETLSLVAGVARTTNNTLEQTAAMIQLMANVGIKGTRAGTTLRRSMLNLSAPSEKINRLFSQLNIEIETQSGTIKPYIVLIGEISEALRDATEGQKQMAFKTLFGARAIAGQIELFAAGAPALRRMVRELELVGDTHEEIAEKQLAAFSEEVGKMKMGVADLSRFMAAKFAPTLRLIVGWVQRLTTSLKKAAEANDTLAGTVVGTGLAMGGLLTMTGAGLTTLASLSLVAMGLDTTLGALILTIAPLLVIITALVALFVLIAFKAGQVREEHRLLGSEISRNTEYLKQATKANKDWYDSYGRLEPTQKLRRIQEHTIAMQEKIRKLNETLGIMHQLMESPGTVKEDFLRRQLKRRNLTVPMTEVSKPVQPGGFGSFGVAGVREQGIDKRRAMKDIVAFEQEKIRRSKATIQALIEADEKAYQQGLDNLAKTKDASAIWFEESLEDARTMYSGMQGYAEELFSVKMNLLEIEQKQQLKDFKQREIYSGALKEEQIRNFQIIQAAHKISQIEQFELEKALRGQSLKEGFKAQMAQHAIETKSLGTVGGESATIIRNAFATALGDMTKDVRNWRDVWTSAIRTIENALINMAAQQVAIQAFGGSTSGRGGSAGTGWVGALASLFGGGGGGNVGSRGFDPGGESKMHSGGMAGSGRGQKPLHPDEFPAVLESGERVLRRGQRAGNPRGEGGTTVQVNITAMDSRSVFKALKPLKKEITSLVQSASRDNHSIRRS